MLALVLSAVLTAQMQETITVRRVLVDARVTNDAGDPITDLTADDFEVEVAGKRAIIESAEWIDDLVERPSTDNRAEPPPPPGRLLIFFVQTDFARDRLRTQGQMKFLRVAEEIIEELAPSDRVAVFSFDSHLKFRLDFTSDQEQIRQALRDTIWIDDPPPPPTVPWPSLSERLDRKAMRRAAHSESALLLVGNALRPIAGPKSLLLLGWGLGELTTGGVKMKRQWTPARYALDAARVSIFALDTTAADYHDLEHGLSSAAKQTGGFYAKTHDFPRIAIDRLQRTLSGHYELSLRVSNDLKVGTRLLDVRVKRRGARVLAPSSIVIRE